MFRLYNAAGEEKINEPGFAPQAVVCGAYITGNPSVGGTGQVVIYNTKSFDPFGFYDTTTGRFQPKIPGYYRVSWWVRDQNNPPVNSYMYSELWKSGAAAVGDGTFMTATGSPDSSNGSVTVYLNGTTDWVDVRHFRGDASTGPLVASGPGHNGFYAELVAASVGVAPEPWHYIGAAGEPGFQNSWTNQGASGAQAAFRKDPHGEVRLRGTIIGGAAPSSAFTLPAGYRPDHDTRFVCVTNNSPDGVAYANSSGLVTVYAVWGGSWIDLSSIRFPADA